MVLEDATYSEKQFLSNLVDNAASSTASVCTATEDGLLLLDAGITLVNHRGEGVNFSYHFGYDPEEVLGSINACFNDHETLEELTGEVTALLAAVSNWGVATLTALDDFSASMKAAQGDTGSHP